MSNYPPGVTDDDPHFNLPSVHDDEEEFDDETMCGVMVDLGSRCGKPITTVVEEPWTPGRFQIRCCDDCAANFISEGYHNRGKAS
jgi:hypothetical protein